MRGLKLPEERREQKASGIFMYNSYHDYCCNYCNWYDYTLFFYALHILRELCYDSYPGFANPGPADSNGVSSVL